MTRSRFVAHWLLLSVGLIVGSHAQAADRRQPSTTLPAFANDSELQGFLEPLRDRWRKLQDEERRRAEETRIAQEQTRIRAAEAHERAAEERRLAERAAEDLRLEQCRRTGKDCAFRAPLMQRPPHQPHEPPASPFPASAVRETDTYPAVNGPRVASTIKTHGKYLVVLRNGRLYSIDLSQDTLAPVSEADVVPLGLKKGKTWLQGMLISGDTIAVIGHHEERATREVHLVRIEANGRLSYQATWQLPFNDIHSEHQVAPRLIDGRLVLHVPQRLTRRWDASDAMPALRRWSSDDRQAAFQPLLVPSRTYQHGLPPDLGDSPLSLHTIFSCTFKHADLDCQATVLFTPVAGGSYASPTAVYFVTGALPPPGQPPEAANVYRMPLDGGAPSVLKVFGIPLDQFSWLETAGGHLNLLLRNSRESNDLSTSSQGLMLLRAPISDFGQGDSVIDDRRLHPLPALAVEDCRVVNGFVGNYLLYGAGCPWPTARHRSSVIHAVAFASTGQPVTKLPLDQATDQIEPMGDDALLVELQEGGRRLRALRLKGNQPQLAECSDSCAAWLDRARSVSIGDRLFTLKDDELVESRAMTQSGKDELIELRRINLKPGSAASRAPLE